MKQHMPGKECSGANKGPVLTCKRLSNSLKRYAGFRAKAELEEVGKNMKEMSLLYSGMRQFCHACSASWQRVAQSCFLVFCDFICDCSLKYGISSSGLVKKERNTVPKEQ